MGRSSTGKNHITGGIAFISLRAKPYGERMGGDRETREEREKETRGGGERGGGERDKRGGEREEGEKERDEREDKTFGYIIINYYGHTFN